jgi:Mor family transcriptional regulator
VTNPRRKTERNAEIVRRYQEGFAISLLAKEYGVSRARINAILDEAGVRKTRWKR